MVLVVFTHTRHAVMKGGLKVAPEKSMKRGKAYWRDGVGLGLMKDVGDIAVEMPQNVSQRTTPSLKKCSHHSNTLRRRPDRSQLLPSFQFSDRSLQFLHKNNQV